MLLKYWIGVLLVLTTWWYSDALVSTSTDRSTSMTMDERLLNVTVSLPMTDADSTALVMASLSRFMAQQVQAHGAGDKCCQNSRCSICCDPNQPVYPCCGTGCICLRYGQACL